MYDCEKPPFLVPPDVTTVGGDDPYAEIHPKPVADIYWDNTQSQFGYVQNRKGNVEVTKEFSRFFRAIKHASAGNYRPQYWILRPEDNENKFLRWVNTPNLDPEARSSYTFVGKIENDDNGPLSMLYNRDLIDPKNLTIVLSDLEEQGLNVTLLAGLIRDKLLKIDDYYAAVIATKLPFNGKNWRPDEKINKMIPIEYSGEKPIYAVISGPRIAVKSFLSTFNNFAQDYKIEYNLVTTFQKGEQKSLDIFEEIGIPNTANNNEVNLQAKKIGITPNLRKLEAYETSLAKERIWNLVECTDFAVNHLRLLVGDELKQIKDRLGLRIFEYEKSSPSWKNNNWLWALNVAFELPKGLKIEDLEFKLKNYRYLKKVQKKIKDEISNEEIKDLKTSKDEEVLKENLFLQEWDSNEEFIRKDLDIYKFNIDNTNKCIFCIYPKHKYGELESSVVCFDIIIKIKQKIEIPRWVEDFNDNDYEHPEKNQNKTFNFKKFINNLLKDEVAENIEYVNYEFIRLPVMLFNMPFEVAK
ncbi:MAG: hypothetical protein ACTTIZ_03095 [Treponema sp.]